MSAELIVSSSPLSVVDATKIKINHGQTIEQMIIGQLPVGEYSDAGNRSICVLKNGTEVHRDNWASNVIAANDQVCITPQPKDPVTIFTIISLAATVYYVSSIEIPNQESVTDAAPSYEAEPQGNRARLGSPLPVHYGRFRFYPDYASYPIQETIGNDKYGFYLFALCDGSIDVDELKFGDTLAQNFEGFEYQQYEPGQRVTLVPSATYSAAEVGAGGIELFGINEENYTVVGPHPSASAGTSAVKLLVDFRLRGLYSSGKKGGLNPAVVNIRIEFRQIDDDGSAVGSWHFRDYTYTDSTIDELRFTEQIDLGGSGQPPIGRYEVRAHRLNAASDRHTVRDEIEWTGLRSYLDDDQVFEYSTLAVKIKITATLSAQSERKFNLIGTGRVPIWDTAIQAWLPSQPTRNPIWAFCDRIKQRGFTDANFKSLDNLAAIADEYDSRGDYFDGRFEQPTNLWAGLQRILRVGRARPTNFGDVFDVVRDDSKARGEYLFTARNTLKSTFSLQHKTVDEWDDHSVIVEYTNPQTWQKEEVVCVLPGTTARNPERVGLLDTTSQVQAQREGMYMVAKKAYRNRVVSLSTELDGRVPSLYDRAMVQSVLPRWGQSGDVVEQDQNNLQILTVSEPLQWQGGAQHYMWFSDDIGANSSSYQINRVYNSDGSVDAYRVEIVETLQHPMYTGYRKEKTRWALGVGGDKPRLMLLTSAAPSGNDQVSLTFESDDPRVHQFDDLVNAGVIPVDPPVQGSEPSDLTMRGVNVVQGGTVDEPEFLISWQPVADAVEYFVGIRYDEASEWRRVYAGAEPSARFTAALGDVYIRVAAMGDAVGPWFELGVQNAGGEFSTPAAPSGVNLAVPFDADVLSVEWLDDVAAVRWRVEYLDTDNNVRWSQDVEEPQALITAAIAVPNGLGREITVRVYAINANGVESAPTSIVAQNSQVEVLAGVSSYLNGNSLYVNFDLPVAKDFSGVVIYNGVPGFNIASAKRYVQTDAKKTSFDIPLINASFTAVRIAGFDVWGDDDLNLSSEILDIAAGVRESDLAQALAQRISRIDAPGTGLVDQLAADRETAVDLIQGLESEFDLLESANADSFAAFQEEIVTLAEDNAAIAQQQQTLQAEVDGQLATIQESQSVEISPGVPGVKLITSMVLDGNGQTVGWGAQNSPDFNGFIFRGDTFALGDASGNEFYPFVFDATTGNLFVQSAYIPDLDVGKITGDVATFIDANFQTVQVGDANVNGIIQSADFNPATKEGIRLDFGDNGGAQLYSLDAVVVEAERLSASSIDAVNTLNIEGASVYLAARLRDSSFEFFGFSGFSSSVSDSFPALTLSLNEGSSHGQLFVLNDVSFSVQARFIYTLIGSFVDGDGGSTTATYGVGVDVYLDLVRGDNVIYTQSYFFTDATVVVYSSNEPVPSSYGGVNSTFSFSRDFLDDYPLSGDNVYSIRFRAVSRVSGSRRGGFVDRSKTAKTNASMLITGGQV